MLAHIPSKIKIKIKDHAINPLQAYTSTAKHRHVPSCHHVRALVHIHPEHHLFLPAVGGNKVRISDSSKDPSTGISAPAGFVRSTGRRRQGVRSGGRIRAASIYTNPRGAAAAEASPNRIFYGEASGRTSNSVVETRSPAAAPPPSRPMRHFARRATGIACHDFRSDLPNAPQLPQLRAGLERPGETGNLKHFTTGCLTTVEPLPWAGLMQKSNPTRISFLFLKKTRITFLLFLL
jgi:hypothetical protein